MPQPGGRASKVNAPPLILTLRLLPDEQARFQRLRDLHFPPERNLVPAHITLFHHLPGAELGAVQAALAWHGAAQPPFNVAVTGLRSLGRGVAYTVDAPALLALRAALAAEWRDWLTPQDRQSYRPHLTIQNKATPDAARILLAGMQAGFAPFTAGATGLLLWHYLGGPWQLAGEEAFAG